mgnify:CR=1 FL=1
MASRVLFCTPHRSHVFSKLWREIGHVAHEKPTGANVLAKIKDSERTYLWCAFDSVHAERAGYSRQSPPCILTQCEVSTKGILKWTFPLKSFGSYSRLWRVA